MRCLRGHPLTTQIKQQIIHEADQGHTIKATAKKLGLGWTTVARIGNGHWKNSRASVTGVKRGNGKRWKAAMTAADSFIMSNAANGNSVTMRQIFYYLVSHNFLKKNKADSVYLGKLIGELRRQGKYRNEITDENRPFYGGDRADNTPEDYIESEIDSLGFSSYYRASWRGQPNYLQVWVEKQALLDTVGSVCEKNRVNYTAAKGFSSLSSIIRALDSFFGHRKGCNLEILLLSDEDPSGWIMETTLRKNIKALDIQGLNVKVTRIGLTQAQLIKYGKLGLTTNLSARAKKLKSQIGYPYNVAWELDCLEPQELQQIVQDEITSRIDAKIWQQNKDEEKAEKEMLEKFTDSVSDYMEEVTDTLKEKWKEFKEEQEEESEEEVD